MRTEAYRPPPPPLDLFEVARHARLLTTVEQSWPRKLSLFGGAAC